MKNFARKLSLATGSAMAAFGTVASQAWAQSQVNLTSTAVSPGTGFATDFGRLLNAILSFVMVLAALLVFLYLIWGGIEWITSGGDKSQTEKARNKITAAIIGLIILAASYAILTLVLRFLGFQDLNDVLNNPVGIN